MFVVKESIQKTYRIPDECSVFQAEINYDLESNNRVVIYVDSQAALKAIDLVDRCKQVLVQYYCKTLHNHIYQNG